MHGKRPPFAASPGPNAEPLVQLVPQGGRDFGRRQHPPDDPPKLAALLRPWIAVLVVEGVFPPRSVPVQSGKAIDLGEALQQAGVKVAGEEVAKPNQRIRLAKRLGIEDRVGGGFESLPELIPLLTRLG